MAIPGFVTHTLGRILAGGALAASVVWAAGWGAERARFGSDTAASRARLEVEVGAQFSGLTDRLDRAVRAASTSAETVRLADQGDVAARRALFDRVSAGAAAAAIDGVAIAIYGATSKPVAWTGRSTLVPDARLSGAATLFLAPGPQGLQLVRIEPLIDATDPARHVGAVVAEAPVSRPGAASAEEAPFALETSLVSVSISPQFAGGAGAGSQSFIVRTPRGDPLAAVAVSDEALLAARRTWRGLTAATECALLAVILLLVTGPLLDWRRMARSAWLTAVLTAMVACLLAGARLLAWVAARQVDGTTPPLTPTARGSALWGLLLGSPLDFVLTSVLGAACVALAATSFGLWRTGRRGGRRQLLVDRPTRRAACVATQLAAGGLVSMLVVGYASFLRTHVAQAPVDILRFALDPWDGARLAVVVGLIAMNAAVVGASVLVLRMARESWAFPEAARAWRRHTVWASLGVALPVVLVYGAATDAPRIPALLVVAATTAAAWSVDRYRAALRHSSQAARLIVYFLALVLPSVVWYPSLVDAAQRARRRIVETRYAPEVTNQRRDVRRRLAEALEQIDRIDALHDLVRATDPAPTGPPSSDAAFLVWSQTGLSNERLTSSVELYTAAGTLASRFALKLPDSAQTWSETSCAWETFEEVSPFFSDERRLLHAGRRLCAPGPGGRPRTAGSVVVHVTLDYGNLSFISGQNPYEALLRSGLPEADPRPRTPVDFTVYGWSRRVLYLSGQTASPLPDDVFRRAYASQAPFWATIDRGGTSIDAYVLNDRGAIYVLGTEHQGVFGYVVTLAELVTLVFVTFVVAVGGGMIFSVVSARTPTSGRALLDEVRASFYRKLFLAFVAAAIVPVLALALVSRAYIASLILADIESEATRTVQIASRVVEDFSSEQARGLASLPAIDDNLAVGLSRMIAQDVNIFDGVNLLASSERNVFASGRLPTRTPGEAYRAILLEGRPSYVGQEAAGGVEYLVAAAPVRLQDRNAVLTVPLTSRQQVTESQIDELDRRVLLAALLFIMVGAGIGYSMAERIADPVNRLMRATRRLARGDLDARVLATSSDEFRRLVEAFNRMAADLQRQRSELERTNRLAAWADMARQVAHDIKNPLTPIQLNAEHLQRVHVDRGRPLGGVIDECVGNILGQVRLLRQISSEFSSFAASPAPAPVETDLAALIEEVVGPYRVGLVGRVAIGVTIAPDLPALRIDRMLIGRALTNVIENALHAMPAGGSLMLEADRTSDHVARLRVTDTGVGMDADGLSKIFEPYFSTRAIGTGLGLTIAKRNIELHGGSIDARSERGRGTTVTITLPLVS